jgi:hypothetical protein
LFGRRTELALVTKFLDAVLLVAGALILGEQTGIAKSTLWLETRTTKRTWKPSTIGGNPGPDGGHRHGSVSTSGRTGAGRRRLRAFRGDPGCHVDHLSSWL